jgi:hypothetical protein
MKYKVILKPMSQVHDWISASNRLAKSLISNSEALNQFNALGAPQRIGIKKAFFEYGLIRKNKIPAGETSNAWELSVMVDTHIIATEYNIDPLTAIVCVSPLCKPNERVYPK